VPAPDESLGEDEVAVERGARLPRRRAANALGYAPAAIGPRGSAASGINR
jgi:hypothetical protein